MSITSTITSIGEGLLLVLLVGTLVKIIYRRLFHPLRLIPGPWLNSVTPIPSALMLLLNKQNSYYYRLHRTYGPVVRVCPDEVSFIDAEAWDEIYGFRKGHIMEKSPIFIGVVSPLNGCVGIGLARGKEHARQRRSLALPFSKSALREQEEIILTHIRKLMGVMRVKADKEEAVDIGSWYSYTTFDIMGDLCFAEPFGCLDQSSATDWSASIVNILLYAVWDQAIRRLVGVDTLLWRILVKLVPSQYTNSRRIHATKTFEKTMQRKRKEELKHKDIMHHLMMNENTPKGLVPTEIVLNMVLLLVAGSETTALLLTALTYCICTNKGEYARLASEIRGRFTDIETIKMDTVKDLPYLDAVVNEALRMFPPASSNQQRTVPAGGAHVSGFFLPAGTTVGVSPWGAARSPLNFCDPDNFRPERWLQVRDPKFAKDRLDASKPFGHGPKACVGQNLSYVETKLIVSRLLWNFELKLEGDVEMSEDRNASWSCKPDTESIRVAQALILPKLWVRLEAIRG